MEPDVEPTPFADTCHPDPCVDMTDEQVTASCRGIILSAIDTIINQLLMDQGPPETDPHNIVDRFATELRDTHDRLKRQWSPPIKILDRDDLSTRARNALV